HAKHLIAVALILFLRMLSSPKLAFELGNTRIVCFPDRAGPPGLCGSDEWRCRKSTWRRGFFQRLTPGMPPKGALIHWLFARHSCASRRGFTTAKLVIQCLCFRWATDAGSRPAPGRRAKSDFLQPATVDSNRCGDPPRFGQYGAAPGCVRRRACQVGRHQQGFALRRPEDRDVVGFIVGAAAGLVA